MFPIKAANERLKESNLLICQSPTKVQLTQIEEEKQRIVDELTALKLELNSQRLESKTSYEALSVSQRELARVKARISELESLAERPERNPDFEKDSGSESPIANIVIQVHEDLEMELENLREEFIRLEHSDRQHEEEVIGLREERIRLAAMHAEET